MVVIVKEMEFVEEVIENDKEFVKVKIWKLKGKDNFVFFCIFVVIIDFGIFNVFVLSFMLLKIVIIVFVFGLYVFLKLIMLFLSLF